MSKWNVKAIELLRQVQEILDNEMDMDILAEASEYEDLSLLNSNGIEDLIDEIEKVANFNRDDWED